MLKYWLYRLLFAGTMFFASGAVADVAGGGGDAGADSGSGGGIDSADSGDSTDAGGAGDGDADAGSGADDGLDAGLDDDAAGSRDQKRTAEDEVDKDTGDFKSAVSRRLQTVIKKSSPALAQALKDPANKEFADFVEATARRDMAFRELYPTIAEARQMREQFPNGMADVEQLLTDVGEVEELDRSFYGRDARGEYVAHPNLIQNWYQDDPQAMQSLFRTAVQLMPRLDPDTYREVGSSIVAATLASSEIPEWLGELVQAADDPKNLPQIKAQLAKLQRWSQGFGKRKAEPTEEERRIQGQREQFKRETDERAKADTQRFRQSLNTDSHKLQQQIIRKHPAVAGLLATKALTEQKKSEIIGKIQAAIQGHLKNSRAFISKYKAALQSGNAKECMDLQRVAWNYPWVLNKFVRQVMATETPNLVRQNREKTGASRTQVQTQRNNAGKSGTQETKHTKPYQEGTVWYKPNGQRFTTSEILRGLHLQG
jgi:hypothetical protein